MGRSESQSSQLPASSGQRGGDTPKQIGGQQEEEEYEGEIESRLNRSFATSEKEKEIFDNYVRLHSIHSTNFSNINLIVYHATPGNVVNFSRAFYIHTS